MIIYASILNATYMIIIICNMHVYLIIAFSLKRINHVTVFNNANELNNQHTYYISTTIYNFIMQLCC